MRPSLATTFGDFRRTLSLSLMVTPRKPPLLEAIDDAIRECRQARDASWPPHFNDYSEALDKLFEARGLVTGERE